MTMLTEIRLDLASLRDLYKSGKATPTNVIAAVYDRIPDGPLEPSRTGLVPREKAMSKARKLERDPLASALPLYGVPFTVDDTIDLAGLPSAARPSAKVVHNVIQAGAIPIGTRRNQPAIEFAGFSLGAPASDFNALVCLTPTRGVISTQGVALAGPPLHSVAIFACSADDAHTVWLAARGFDPDDPFSRTARPGEDAAPWLAGNFHFGVPHGAQLGEVIARFEAIGGRKVEIDFSLFRSAAELAGRYAAIPCGATDALWDQMDVLTLPPGDEAGIIELLDLAAVSLPAGVALIGRAFSDEALLILAERFSTSSPADQACPPGCIPLAVIGDWNLTDRGAHLIKACRTAPDYRLYALEGRSPKPYLVRDPDFLGPGIEVEVWAIPEDRFGSFVAAIPAPLGIGTATLEDGQPVKSFFCEPYALAQSVSIKPD
uniref:Urea carboxylase n=1 Tax=Solibacter usitatus (strain Ellin6076) TaxID=234267 RepID=Q021I8_SOLUE